MRLAHLLTLGTLLASLALPPAVPAGLLPQGSEFQVNTHTTATQRGTRAVARAADGSFVVVWETYDTEDGSGESIQAQRYDASGAPLGTQFQVNSYTTGNQSGSAVAAAADGSFIVVWTSAQDGSGGSVQGQRYDGSGATLGTEFQINSYTTSSQGFPAVSIASDGDFVVVWVSNAQDGSVEGVFGQRFDGGGAPVGTEFQANSYTTDSQRNPDVAAASDGSFMVVWESRNQDGGNFGVFGQRYDSTGAAAGTEFQVNTFTTSFQVGPVVARLAGGGFVVAWGSDSQDGDGYGIEAQRFDASGSTLGSEFQVNSFTTGYQNYASIAASANGSFVIAWASYPQDGDSWSVQARLFDAGATPVGGELQVNTYTTGYQWVSSVGADASGNFVVTWASDGQDGSQDGMFAQRLCEDADADLACDSVFAVEAVNEPVGAGGTVTSDSEADGATPSDPIESSVTSPNAGQVTLQESVVSTNPPIFQIDITAPEATVGDPLVLTFRVDATLAASFQVLKNGVMVSSTCTGAPGTADPDPCVDSVATLGDGDALVTILTSTASQWRLEGVTEDCPSTPATGCITGAKASFQLKDSGDEAKRQLKWKLTKAGAFDQSMLGDPASTRAYTLCIYDESGDVPALVGSAHVSPNAGWQSKDPKGFKYVDKTGAEDGVTKGALKAGAEGKAAASISAKGANLTLPTALSANQFFAQDTAVIVQLVNDETATCWTSEFTNAIKNDGAQFKAKAP